VALLRDQGQGVAVTERIERPGAQAWVPEQGDIEALRQAAPACRGCELWEPASQVVFSAGDVRAKVALVGEQPGDVEDREGIPFVGPAGKLLQRALDDAGVDRAHVYVTNAVKHFRFTPRGNRRIHQTPEMAHITACKPWLVAELRVVDPTVVVLLGATAAKSLMGPDFRVTKHRGEVIRRETSRGPRDFVPTVHPSSVLRAPDDQRDEAFGALVADLRVVAGLLEPSA
jgi:uracil-DNA glycosylase family protein